MAEGSDAQKFATGLGIVVSIIGVLAFFGITNFDDLKNDQSEACNAAFAARNAFEGALPGTPQKDLSPEMSRYAQRLLEAVDLTDDKELRARLREAAYARQTFADSAEVDIGTLYQRRQDADITTGKWISLCK
ncbi:hypothetical protein ACFU76_27570 [Streptomyces sp. NPDC057539]|uniref:hypothetical protein n=1 Tax=Streptomyces sp. NPDC057539 TaxID=3346159 RepID=UPI0036AAB53B